VEIAFTHYQINDKTVTQCAVRNTAGRKLMEVNLKRLTEELQSKSNELEAAQKALRKLDELKSEFVSVVSHELRTPLATMLQFTSIISDEIPGKLTEEQKQYINIIKENIGRLTRLISNLLDISNLEAGKIELKKTLIDLADLVAGILAGLKAQADEKHIELRTRISEPGIHVCADPERVTQIFINLIGNALRFTQESGQLTVEIKDTGNEIECSVADTGIGISEKDLPKVFSKFQQFGRVPGTGEKGTGLGLSIAKNIVEMHHGKIWAESKIGEGTKFTFTLPKYTAESLFKEYVTNAILELRKHGVKRSLMVVSLIHFEKLKQELPPGRPQAILKDIEGILKNSLQNEGDIAVKDTGKVIVILVIYNEKDSLAVKGKLWQVLGDYLARQDLSQKIMLRFGDKYPDEAKSEGG
jgi:signal transduction histidine kinase